MKMTAKIDRTFSGDSNIKAFASITLNDEFAIKGISVRNGQNGLYVQMPWQKTGGKNGEKPSYNDVAFPTTSEGRKQLNEAVLDAYEKAVSKQAQNFSEHEADDALEMD